MRRMPNFSVPHPYPDYGSGWMNNHPRLRAAELAKRGAAGIEYGGDGADMPMADDFSMQLAMMRGAGNRFGLPQQRGRQGEAIDNNKLLEDFGFVSEVAKAINKRGGDWRSFLAPIVTRRDVDSEEFLDAPMMPGPRGQAYSQNMAMVPRVWKSHPDHDPAMLAYITRTEAEKLRELDMHDSGIEERMHYGPQGVPSFQGDGVGGDSGSDSGSGADSATDGMSGSGDAGEDASGKGSEGRAGGDDSETGTGFGDGGFDGPGGWGDPGRDYDDSSSRTGPAPGPEGFDFDSSFGPQMEQYGPPSPNFGQRLGMAAARLGEWAGFPQDPKAMTQEQAVRSIMGPVFGTGINALNQGLRSIFGEPDKPSKDDVGAAGKDAPGGGPNEGGDNRAQVRAALQRGFSRPSEREAPPFLGMHPAMTNLQRRANIATFATQGMDSRYRDNDTLDYWRNLIQRDLISDAGDLAEFGNVLPVELQMIEQFMGKGRPSSTQSLLEAIAAS